MAEAFGGVGSLGAVGSVAARPYGSLDEALGAVFEVARRALGMRSVFLSRIDAARRTFRLLAVASDPGGCALAPGDESPLERHY